ncbi:MAG: N-acetylmuramoyl-L-alanine amidase [Syntrophales bacterium]
MNLRKVAIQALIAFIVIGGITFLPGRSDAFPQSQPQYRVIIDPGHGGTDSGVRITGSIVEKDLTLAIAFLVKQELEKSGQVTVWLTRTSDKTMSGEERSRFITSVKPAIVVSIHLNAGFGKAASGFEVYFSGFGRQTGTQKSRESGEAGNIVRDMAANSYLNESVRLARLILKDQENVFPRKGRGLREAPLPLQESIGVPYVLMEIGFATQEENRKKIMDESTRHDVAHALAHSIQAYFRKEMP